MRASQSGPASSPPGGGAASICVITSLSLDELSPTPRSSSWRRSVERVGQVAVVRDAQRAVHGLDQVRLGIPDVRRAAGRIAGVADGQVALQRAQVLLVEDLRHQAHVLVDVGRAGRRWSRCRRSPGRGAAAHTARRR